MRWIQSLTFAVPLALGMFLAAAAPAAPAPADTSGPSIRQFLEIRAPGSPTLLPDDSYLVRDNPDGIYQLYRVAPRRLDNGNLSYRPADVTVTRLTDYPDGLSDFSVSPDSRRVVLMHARGGNENTQLTVLDLASGTTRPALSNPAVQAAINVWFPDGSGFIFSANLDSPTDFYLYRYDLDSGRTSRVLAEAGSWRARAVSHDATRVLLEHDLSASDVQVHELDLKSGKLTELTLRPASGTAACSVAGYMPGDREVLMLSDYRDGISRLYARQLATGAVRAPLGVTGRLEMEQAGVNDAQTFLLAALNQDGYRIPRVYSLPDFRLLPAPPGERGLVSPDNFRGRTLTWSLTNTRTPLTCYATSYPERGAPVTRQITWPDTRGIPLESFPLPQLVHYPAFDRRSIPAFLFLPSGWTKGKPIPFIVYYHGGPEGQSRPQFSATMQYFVSRGYGVMMPNVRGSTGYGRSYQMLDDYKNRWNSVKDGVDAAEWLARSGYALPGRIATFGGSYGGFMSVACIVEDQERVNRGVRNQRLFGACVDVVGIVNMRGFLEKTSGYRRKLREVEYGPLADTTFLASVSSIRRVDDIRVPVFIGHGFNDPRVPVEEAMQLAIALKDRKREPRLFIAPDEGHGFAKLDNRIYFYERAAAFLDETIRGMKPAGDDAGEAAIR